MHVVGSAFSSLISVPFSEEKICIARGLTPLLSCRLYVWRIVWGLPHKPGSGPPSAQEHRSCPVSFQPVIFHLLRKGILCCWVPGSISLPHETWMRSWTLDQTPYLLVLFFIILLSGGVFCLFVFEYPAQQDGWQFNQFFFEVTLYLVSLLG